jgi:glucans biosynthesis protein
MDSPSVTGAYRFDIHPAERLVMDVDAALYPRRDIERAGIAALTSMFQCGENDRRMANDWRPEIHDSDGLAMWSGSGEWLWRPLVNPQRIRFSAFADDNPRGFGLLQRDRDFGHYQDDGAFYERRPSLWVEPKSGWGKGSVQLVELPTDDETNDNIVAFWTPDAKPRAGEERLFSYRLHWGPRPPVQAPAARVAATRTGIGGIVGQKRKYTSWRFAIDFEGGDLSLVGDESQMVPVITPSRGSVELTSARPLKSIQGYRAMFDLRLPDEQPVAVELRLYLSYRGQPMSETWCYQWTPPAPRNSA